MPAFSTLLCARRGGEKVFVLLTKRDRYPHFFPSYTQETRQKRGVSLIFLSQSVLDHNGA